MSTAKLREALADLLAKWTAYSKTFSSVHCDAEGATWADWCKARSEHGEAVSRARVALAEAPGEGRAWPTCATCHRPATCLGVYEDQNDPPRWACDTCCGHGNEDGHCYRLPGSPDPEKSSRRAAPASPEPREPDLSRSCPVHEGEPMRPRLWRCDKCHAKAEALAAPASPEPRPPMTWDRRAADALAVEVEKLIERKVIDSRSPAGDALLDYRDGKPQGPHLAASPEPEGERASMWECSKCRRRFYAMSQSHPRECRPGDCADDRPASPPSPTPREIAGMSIRDVQDALAEGSAQAFSISGERSEAPSPAPEAATSPLVPLCSNPLHAHVSRAEARRCASRAPAPSPAPRCKAIVCKNHDTPPDASGHCICETGECGRPLPCPYHSASNAPAPSSPAPGKGEP